MSWRGVFSGALALIALQAVLSSEQSASRFSGLLTGVGNLTRAFMSPAVPAIPDLSNTTE